MFRQPRIESKPYRDGARGQVCTGQIPGACNGDPATVVLCHFPFIDGEAGMGSKTHDVCAGDLCSGCHDAIDRRAKVYGKHLTDSDRLYYAARAMARTLVSRHSDGLLRLGRK